jgi:hypothetical protein
MDAGQVRQWPGDGRTMAAIGCGLVTGREGGKVGQSPSLIGVLPVLGEKICGAQRRKFSKIPKQFLRTKKGHAEWKRVP